MLHLAFLVLAFIKAGWSQQDCGCNLPLRNRQYCVSAPFPRNRYECENAGCCYNSAIISLGLRCYERDVQQCPRDFEEYFDSCTIATPAQQCGSGFDEDTCESVGCCYLPEFTPSCFVSASGSRRQFTSEWGVWSRCSSPCSSGTRSRSRKCLTQNPFECNRRSINLAETEICNAHICASWSNWIPSRCSVTCGSGIIRYTRNCRGFGSRGPTNCYSATASCILPKCPTAIPNTVFQIVANWAQWQQWQVCDNPCGTGKQSRTRACLVNGVVVNSERCRVAQGTSSHQTKVCNVHLCSTWTSWTPSSECTKTCGSRATRFVTRRCTDLLQTDAQSGLRQRCSGRQEPCILLPCPTSNNADTKSTTERSQEIVTVPTGNPSNIFTIGLPPSSTSTSAPEISSTTGDGVFTINWLITTVVPLPTRTPTTESNTASSTIIASKSEVVSASTITPTTTATSAEFEMTTPPFGESTVPMTPFGSEIPTLENGSETAASWLPWSTWTKCTKICGMGIQIRSRNCAFRNGSMAQSQTACENDAIETAVCNTGVCNISSTISTEIVTTQTPTKPGLETLGSSTLRADETPTAEWENWKPWSDCSSTCSPGFRTRSRDCKRISNDLVAVDPIQCNRNDPGSMYDEAVCNGDLCTRWTEWRSTGCSITCNRGPDEPPGVTLTRRRCQDSETELADEACYLLSDTCNAIEPCPVSSTTTLQSGTVPSSITIDDTTITASTTSAPIVLTVSTETPLPREPNGNIWSEWGEWSPCSSSCAPGIQNRVRQCLPNVPKQLCINGGFSTRDCNLELCTGWSEWRTTPCDKTCGEEGSQVKRRICLSGQLTESMPETCHAVSEPCRSNLSCSDMHAYPKLDILFLVDSSTHVDDCDAIQKREDISPPLRSPQLSNMTAPNYARIKKFMTDFTATWKGISNSGTRVGIQLISGLCNGRTRANLYVEKRYNETHEFLKEYIAEMPYLCGDFWLDWAMQCSYSPVMTERYGDRKDIPNVVVLIVSDVPKASLPRASLLQRIVRRLRTKAAILSVTATQTAQLGALSRQRYIDHTRNLACNDGTQCSRFLGSIWDLESSAVAEKIRIAVGQIGKS